LKTTEKGKDLISWNPTNPTGQKRSKRRRAKKGYPKEGTSKEFNLKAGQTRGTSGAETERKGNVSKATTLRTRAQKKWYQKKTQDPNPPKNQDNLGEAQRRKGWGTIPKPIPTKKKRAEEKTKTK